MTWVRDRCAKYMSSMLKEHLRVQRRFGMHHLPDDTVLKSFQVYAIYPFFTSTQLIHLS